MEREHRSGQGDDTGSSQRAVRRRQLVVGSCVGLGVLLATELLVPELVREGPEVCGAVAMLGGIVTVLAVAKWRPLWLPDWLREEQSCGAPSA